MQSDDPDLILVTQSNIVDYDGLGDLPIERLDLFKGLVYPRMVHHEGRFRSHLDFYNHRKFGKFFEEGTFEERRQMYNIWNLPSMSGMHVANYLLQFGIKVKIINNLDSEWDWFCEAYAACSRPPLVGISSTFYLSWKQVGAIAKRLRALDPDMDLVVGGAFANAETIHQSEDQFERRMRNYGIRYVLHAFNSERDLRDLVLAWRAGKGMEDVTNLASIEGDLRTGAFSTGMKIWHKPLLSLTDSPPTWDRLDMPFVNRTIQIRTASGCPFACAFCSYPTTAGPWQTVESEHIRAHLDAVARIPGVDRIIFIDDTFNVPPHRFKELLKILMDYKFEWFSFLRVQYVDDETVRMMKDSGCKGVYLGIESASDQILLNMNKKATSAQFARGVNLLNKHGIEYLAAFVLGFPGETEQTIQQNVSFIRDNGVSYYSLKEFYYMAHTLVHEQREQFGLTGMGSRWSHATMNSDQATQIKLDIFQDVAQSTHIDPDTSLWYMAYLYDQGVSFSAMRGVQEEINGLMKRQLAAAHAQVPAPVSPGSGGSVTA
jgi:anaerobic magnesium-protoporphyrin IX monomethyl ester cyclase